MIHILRSFIKESGQWSATCSCGNQSIDPSKFEAVNLHRTHITEALRGADRFTQAEALNTGETD